MDERDSSGLLVEDRRPLDEDFFNLENLEGTDLQIIHFIRPGPLRCRIDLSLFHRGLFYEEIGHAPRAGDVVCRVCGAWLDQCKCSPDLEVTPKIEDLKLYPVSRGGEVKGWNNPPSDTQARMFRATERTSDEAAVSKDASCYFCATKRENLVRVNSTGALTCVPCAVAHLGGAPGE